MKLAEALSIRKDLQKRIQQLGQRIQNNVKVQEGDEPKEQPAELMKELDNLPFSTSGTYLAHQRHQYGNEEQ